MQGKCFLRKKKRHTSTFDHALLPKIGKKKFLRQSWTLISGLFCENTVFITPQAFQKRNLRPFLYLYGSPLLFAM